MHACMHSEPLQHSLFELAVDGQHLWVADKGKGQDGDGVGRLWKVIEKKIKESGSSKPHISHFNTDNRDGRTLLKTLPLLNPPQKNPFCPICLV